MNGKNLEATIDLVEAAKMAKLICETHKNQIEEIETRLECMKRNHSDLVDYVEKLNAAIIK